MGVLVFDRKGKEGPLRRYQQGGEGLSQAAVWRENVLSSGNRKCKGPGDHQGGLCGGTEWTEDQIMWGWGAAVRILDLLRGSGSEGRVLKRDRI